MGNMMDDMKDKVNDTKDNMDDKAHEFKGRMDEKMNQNDQEDTTDSTIGNS